MSAALEPIFDIKGIHILTDDTYLHVQISNSGALNVESSFIISLFLSSIVAMHGINGAIFLPMILLRLLTIFATVHGFIAPRSFELTSSKLQPHASSYSSAKPRYSQSDDDSIFYNDFEDIGFGTEDLNLSQLLQKRSTELKQDERRIIKNWRSGKANSYGAFSINERYLIDREEGLPFDWVRRVDIGQYPRVVCGSAHGSIFVADVEEKKILGEARGVHYSHHSEDFVNCLDEQLRQYIYGEYDGGGVLDVAMFGRSLIASSGREGGVKIFKFQRDELIYQGDVPALIRRMPGALPVIVTCMKFDSLGRLYLGCSDGFLRIVSFPLAFITAEAGLDSEELDVTIIHPNEKRAGSPSPILSLDVSEELGMIATAHTSGDVCIYSMKEKENRTILGELKGVWNPFAKSRSHARSVTFVSMEKRGTPRHAVAVGGGNGQIWVNDIDPSFSTSKNSPLLVYTNNDAAKVRPDHTGPVLSLASRPGGIIVSVGHDGLLRVTDVWLGREDMKTTLMQEISPLYGIGGGLKVWVGSVCTDDEGKRLISDGFDDAVVVHDFSAANDDSDSK